MKQPNGFFSFSLLTVSLLALALAMTTASLAWQHYRMARTYEETVRLTYLAESALAEGWEQLQQNPEIVMPEQDIPVPLAEKLAARGECLSVHCRYYPASQPAGGFLQALAAAPEMEVQQTCSLRFEAAVDEQGHAVWRRGPYVN